MVIHYEPAHVVTPGCVEEILELYPEEKVFRLDVIILPAELKQRLPFSAILGKELVDIYHYLRAATSAPVNQLSEFHSTMLPSRSDRHSAAFSMK